PVSLREAVALRTDLPGYFAWEALRGAETSSSDRTAGAPASTGARERAGARLCVGPEGGFVADEARLLQEAGFRPLGLGPYTLRTGTAALVGVARLLAP
ncbi:MAG TPA: RsmE family RNA methyltransferase, partial [Nannocystis sp.]